MPKDPEAAEVQEDKQQQREEEEEVKEEAVEEEEEGEDEAEERERINTLLQRKKLLQDLGVVDQIRQLLQDRTGGGGVPKEACAQQQSQRAHQTRQVRRCAWNGHIHNRSSRRLCSGGIVHLFVVN